MQQHRSIQIPHPPGQYNLGYSSTFHSHWQHTARGIPLQLQPKIAIEIMLEETPKVSISAGTPIYVQICDVLHRISTCNSFSDCTFKTKYTCDNKLRQQCGQQYTRSWTRDTSVLSVTRIHAPPKPLKHEPYSYDEQYSRSRVECTFSGNLQRRHENGLTDGGRRQIAYHLSGVSLRLVDHDLGKNLALPLVRSL